MWIYTYKTCEVKWHFLSIPLPFSLPISDVAVDVVQANSSACSWMNRKHMQCVCVPVWTLCGGTRVWIIQNAWFCNLCFPPNNISWAFMIECLRAYFVFFCCWNLPWRCRGFWKIPVFASSRSMVPRTWIPPWHGTVWSPAWPVKHIEMHNCHIGKTISSV